MFEIVAPGASVPGPIGVDEGTHSMSGSLVPLAVVPIPLGILGVGKSSQVPRILSIAML